LGTIAEKEQIQRFNVLMELLELQMDCTIYLNALRVHLDSGVLMVPLEDNVKQDISAFSVTVAPNLITQIQITQLDFHGLIMLIIFFNFVVLSLISALLDLKLQYLALLGLQTTKPVELLKYQVATSVQQVLNVSTVNKVFAILDTFALAME